ncbi:hypothetical protein D3C76_637490 [compost metagenome]
MRLEDTLLLGRRQARVQRQNLGMAQLRLAQDLGGITDFPLARQEDQHIARALAFAAFVLRQLVEGGKDGLIDSEVILDLVALFVLLAGQRAVPGVHREGAPGHLDDRRTVEVPGEALQVDGGRGDDQFQVRSAMQQRFQVAEQEVDVQAALVRFVDDDRVIAFKEAVMLGFGQEDAVGHQLDQGVGIALVFETHLVADQRAQGRAQLFGDSRGHATRCDPAWLGMGDQPMAATAKFQADFRQLGRLARAGLAGDHQHLVFGQGLLDFVTLGGDGQVVVVAYGRHALLTRGDLSAGGLDLLHPLRQLRLVGALAQFVQLPAQAMAVGNHGVVEVLQQFVDGVVSHGAF